ncbi:hypothetical protein ACHAXT_005684 [Thalassiosira profunda]
MAANGDGDGGSRPEHHAPRRSPAVRLAAVIFALAAELRSSSIMVPRGSMADDTTRQASAWRRRLIVALSVAVLSSLSIYSLRRLGSAAGDGGVQLQLNATYNSTETCTCTEPPADERTSIAAALGLQGDVSDCCCSFDDLERKNFEEVHPLLQRVVATPFFSHFKVDLCSECQLWSDAPLCVLRDCGVCECERPPEWADNVEWLPEVEVEADEDCGHVDDRVVTAVDVHVTEGWTASDAFSSEPLFFEQPANKEDTAVVVDLRLNPERYTGYAGQSAEKVWKAVHEENCFRQKEDVDGHCTLSTDERVYNRIISGMHSSISLHIAHSYCLEMSAEHIAECKVWGANSTLAQERVLSHKDRLENLYVVFAVMLRAVQKAGPAITEAVPVDDPFYANSLAEWKDHLQPELARVMESCPPTFDETSLFSESISQGDADARRAELKRRFRHLLDCMECVGCDRCKLWGTLQTLGVGTALRIIIDDDESQATNLSRQEAVALVHTLERFSSALVYAHTIQEELM